MLHTVLSLFSFSGAACDPTEGKNEFFGIPHWYEYMHTGVQDAYGKCVPKLTQLKDIWLIALAVVDILLFIAGFVAVFAVFFGGFRYLTSGGEPDKTKQAWDTIKNGLIGAVITIIAATVVTFVARSLGNA